MPRTFSHAVSPLWQLGIPAFTNPMPSLISLLSSQLPVVVLCQTLWTDLCICSICPQTQEVYYAYFWDFFPLYSFLFLVSCPSNSTCLINTKLFIFFLHPMRTLPSISVPLPCHDFESVLWCKCEVIPCVLLSRATALQYLLSND